MEAAERALLKKLRAGLVGDFGIQSSLRKSRGARTSNRKRPARHDERIDPLLYRLFKVFARGSHERALPIAEGRSFDTDQMVDLLRRVVEEVAASGKFGNRRPRLALYSAESPGRVSHVRVRAA